MDIRGIGLPMSCYKALVSSEIKTVEDLSNITHEKLEEILKNPNHMKVVQRQLRLFKSILNRAETNEIGAQKEVEKCVWEIGLASYVVNVLRNNDIETVEQLKSYSDEELLQFKGLGLRTVYQIRKRLNDIDSSLNKEAEITLESSLWELDLRVEIRAFLVRKGIKTIVELVQYSADDILGLRGTAQKGIARKGLELIINELNKAGFSLKQKEADKN